MFLNRGGSVRSKTPSHRGHRGGHKRASAEASPGLLGFHSGAELDAVSLLSNPNSTHPSMQNIAVPSATTTNPRQPQSQQHTSSSGSSNASAVSLPSTGEDRDQLMEMTSASSTFQNQTTASVYNSSRSSNAQVIGKHVNGGNSSNDFLSIEEVAPCQQVINCKSTQQVITNLPIVYSFAEHA